MYHQFRILVCTYSGAPVDLILMAGVAENELPLDKHIHIRRVLTFLLHVVEFHFFFIFKRFRNYLIANTILKCFPHTSLEAHWFLVYSCTHSPRLYITSSYRISLSF
jgi:hypothetical protein